MPLLISSAAPTFLIRKAAFEQAGLTRQAVDERFGLTDQEFRVEGPLIAVGPLFDEDAVGDLIQELEGAGLSYFEDFFDLSGNWPEWLRILAMGG